MKKIENKTNQTENRKSKKKVDQTVEVLYQKMGDRWFAFSMVGDDVFVGSIPQSEIDLNHEFKTTTK